MELSSRLSSTWHIHTELSWEQIQTYEQANIDRITAQLLHNRGITDVEEMHAFLDAQYEQTPDPFSLPDMRKAVERIRQAFDNREHITVYGDYDADGVTSSALMTRALRTLNSGNAILDCYIPSRLNEGCGLNMKALDLLKERGTSLIITTDCGSSDVEQVIYARDLGMDVIITDHHQPPAILPDAYALVNPWREQSEYRERYLCGVGVAFKVAQALYRTYQRPEEDEMSLLDLMAVGTIADVVPLLGENHTLVRLGLKKLNTSPIAGLLALIQKANLRMGRIRERDIAYALAPRINAAGRMEHARIAFELLTTDDANEVSERVEDLEKLNLSRQDQTQELMQLAREEAQQHADARVILVSGIDWHEGIIGLVAGKLSEEMNRPIFVLSQGEKFSRGSARSPKGFNIIAALRTRADMFERYGGHAQAAGFTIANERIEALREHLLNWNEAEQTEQDEAAQLELVSPTEEQSKAVLEIESIPDNTILPLAEIQSTQSIQNNQNEQNGLHSHMIDILFTRSEHLSSKTYTEIQRVGPFGAGNPEPIFKMKKVYLQHCWKSGLENRNLGMKLSIGSKTFQGTLMRGGERFAEFTPRSNVTILFRLERSWNNGNGNSGQDVWLKLVDVEAE